MPTDAYRRTRLKNTPHRLLRVSIIGVVGAACTALALPALAGPPKTDKNMHTGQSSFIGCATAPDAEGKGTGWFTTFDGTLSY